MTDLKKLLVVLQVSSEVGRTADVDATALKIANGISSVPVTEFQLEHTWINQYGPGVDGLHYTAMGLPKS